MSDECCEYCKDVSGYGNAYALGVLLDDIKQLQAMLSVYTHEDSFLNLKRELHGYQKAMEARRRELKGAEMISDAHLS